MTFDSPGTALVGAVGVVASVVGSAAAVATVLVALGLPAEGRADDPPVTPTVARPSALVVALDLADPARQVGVVRDGEVILARGLEVEIARNLAKRLGIPRVSFVFVRPSSRLLAAQSRAWHVAIASIRPTRDASATADLSAPYLGTDQAVVLRRGLSPLSTLRGLGSKITCAVRGSDGARALASAVVPVVRPTLAASNERLLELVQTGVCDAALVDATEVGAFVSGHGALLGPVRGRVAYGGGFVVAVTRGGPIAVAEVDRALARMRADGTMHRLTRAWLGIDPARLQPLR